MKLGIIAETDEMVDFLRSLYPNGLAWCKEFKSCLDGEMFIETAFVVETDKDDLLKIMSSESPVNNLHIHKPTGFTDIGLDAEAEIWF